MAQHLPRAKPAMALAALASLTMVGGAAFAQSNAGGNAAANTAYVRANLPADAAARDAKGQALTTDGVIQAGQDESGLAHSGGGTLDTIAGVGSGSGVTEFGASLSVVTAASSQSAATTQSNADAKSAPTSAGDTTLAGGVSDDPH